MDARRGVERNEAVASLAEAVQSLVEVMKARDPCLGEHVVGVSRVARRVGEEMSLDREQIDILVVGALLHDVGKVGIPDAVLYKPGPLSEEEYETIKRHPDLGVGIVVPLAGLASTLPVIKHHHERPDGRGYPDGLRGEDIPLLARIVSAADAFDSMVRGRPYGRGVPVEAALREIEDNCGTQFDHRVSDTLSKVARGIGKTGSDVGCWTGE